MRWLGYGSDEDSWEPCKNLDQCPEILQKFELGRKGRAITPEILEKDATYPVTTSMKKAELSAKEEDTDTHLILPTGSSLSREVNLPLERKYHYSPLLKITL